MTETLGFPAPLAALAIATELIAPFALIFGLGGRLASLGIIGIMAGAISTHAPNGFFMNWFGSLPGGHRRLRVPPALRCASPPSSSANGSGALSVDRLFTRTSGCTRQSDWSVRFDSGRQARR